MYLDDEFPDQKNEYTQRVEIKVSKPLALLIELQ